MKYLFVAFSVLLLINNSNGQIKKLPTNILKEKDWIITSRSTAHKGYENIKISLTTSKTEGKGETLVFTSNTDITKVEFSFLKTKLPKNTYLNNAGVKTYSFFLESGAYSGGLKNGYLLHFYIKNFDKPIWVGLLTK